MSSSSEFPIFTNIFLSLYLEFVEDSSTSAASLDNLSLVLSLAYNLLVLDPVAPLSPEPLVGIDLHRFTRVSVPPYLTDYHYSFTLATFYEPHTYREAHTDPLWQQAMSKELDVLHKNHTWDIVDFPLGQSVVGYKWVYKIKIKAGGSIKRYKACLIAKCFAQEYGTNYEETFGLITRLTSIRCLIVVAVIRYWPLYQMNVKNAFLNGDLQKEVYKQPPPGHTYLSRQVCRLHCALYGLKQAPQTWFEKFSLVVAQQGFTSSPHGTTLFVRRSSAGITLILSYVDDMTITGNDSVSIHSLQHFFN